MNTFYITAAIDYPNSLPHIGTAYEKICCDSIARFKRLLGYDVYFLMGNDEHSINVSRAAATNGETPQAYCDRMASEFRRVWSKLSIEPSDFIRTTERRHCESVQILFRRMSERGDIYKGTYEGWYCESCEAFLSDQDLVDGMCAIHRRVPGKIREGNYFFALSRYRDPLLRHIESHPEFVQPHWRKNEIVKFLEAGLDDISVSRASFDWGIEVPGDPSQKLYVWVDALSNYITALGYGTGGELFDRYWPADCQMVGKDITRFHAIIWPAMLLSAGVALPKTVFGHGFVHLKGEKMSKSLGNVVRPLDIADAYGPDALRYFLLREIPFGQDGDFTWERFIDRYNADLANDLGNLVSRTVTMVNRYLGGVVPPAPGGSDHSSLREKAGSVVEAVTRDIEALSLNGVLDSIWELVREANRMVETKAPWELAKDPARRPELESTLYDLLETCRYLSILLFPVMPNVCGMIWDQIGAQGDLPSQRIEALKVWGGLPSGVRLSQVRPLFPRIERVKDHAAPASGEGTVESSDGGSRGESASAPTVGEGGPSEAASAPATAQARPETASQGETVTIEEFQRIDLRVALVVAVAKVQGADRLVKLQLDVGGEPRQIVAGIAQRYPTDQLVGKRIVIVANLRPATIRGVESRGMLLAADDGAMLGVLTPDMDVAPGAKVK